MDTLDNLSIAASVSAISFLIYKTDFIAEYAKIFRLGNLLKIDYYQCFRIQNNGKGNYPEFLKFLNNNFITRLFSCPYCFGFWLCVIITKANFNCLAVYAYYLIMYNILNLENGKNP